MSRRPKKDRVLDHRNSDRRQKTASGATTFGTAPTTSRSGSGIASDAITRPQDSRRALVVCGLLLLAVALVFGQTIRHGFVNYDDDEYVCAVPQVVQGLSVEGIGWAFVGSHANNWHPLTWLSHMLDCDLYGLNAGGHHLTSVLLHAAVAILLLLTLWRMTGNLWPSAFAAAVFAVHPLRVESVAWVAERKDILSGLFFMLTLAAYVGCVRRNFSLARYLSVVALFALGLMAKPMLVTLPLVLLLLDYWPLGRMTSATARRLVIEKVPLLLLTAASCVATALAQGEAIQALETVPMTARLANALVSYVEYLGQFFYPAGLAVLYPHPGSSLPVWKVIGAALVLAGVSATAVVWRRRLPYLFVGWFWYVGMLVPVIGLVQIGEQAMADRYTYLPQIGLCIAVAWGVADAVATWPAVGRACGVVSAVVLLMLMGCAWRQTQYWRDSETLWTRTLDCTARNAVAHNNLGTELSNRHDFDAAVAHYQEALAIKPDYVEAHNNLGAALQHCGRTDEAMAHYKKALELKPDYVQAHCNFGVDLFSRGQYEEAIAEYETALAISPDCAEAHYNLAVALASRRKIDAAIDHYQRAIDAKPDYAEACNNLGTLLATTGQFQQGIPYLQKALELKPDYANAHSNLGLALARTGQPDAAIAHYQRALELKPDFATAHTNLAEVLAERGQLGAAVDHFRKALAIGPDSADARLKLGMVLTGQGKVAEAVAQWRAAARLQPNQIAVVSRLAWVLATCSDASVRSGAEAVELAERAQKLTGGKEPSILAVLASAYAEAGRFPEAVQTAESAISLASAQDKAALAEVLRTQLKLYRAGEPYRDVQATGGR